MPRVVNVLDTSVNRAVSSATTRGARRRDVGRLEERNDGEVPVLGARSAGAVPERTPDLERRGRAWLLWGFLLCPCHLPLTLGVLAAVAGGTTLGGVLRDNTVAAGVVVTVTWVAATGYGLGLIRRAERAGGTCPLPRR